MEAIQSYKRALSVDPTLLDAREYLAVALQNLGRTNEACLEIHRVVKLGSNQPRTFVHAAFIMLQAKKFQDAEIFARRARQMDSDNRYAIVNLAFALSGQGKTEESQIEIKSLGEVVTLPSDIKFQLGQFYISVSNFLNAQTYFNYCIEEGFEVDKSLINLATCLIRQRCYLKAKDYLSLVRSTDPVDRANVHQNYAVIASALRDHKTAQDQLRRCLEANPSNVKALINLALSFNDEARYDEVDQFFETGSWER